MVNYHVLKLTAGDAVTLVASFFMTILCTASRRKLLVSMSLCEENLIVLRHALQALILVFPAHKGPILKLWVGAEKQKNNAY